MLIARFGDSGWLTEDLRGQKGLTPDILDSSFSEHLLVVGRDNCAQLCKRVLVKTGWWWLLSAGLGLIGRLFGVHVPERKTHHLVVQGVIDRYYHDCVWGG